jgi:hypothetical protein
MSRGKYSPVWVKKECSFNCYGKVPAPWNSEVIADGVQYDEKTMFGNYDHEGFDSYGYSCFDSDGKYVGIGNGVDRNGYTEMDYLSMDEDTFYNLT